MTGEADPADAAGSGLATATEALTSNSTEADAPGLAALELAAEAIADGLAGAKEAIPDGIPAGGGGRA